MNDVLLFLQEMEQRLNERFDQVEIRLNGFEKRLDEFENQLKGFGNRLDGFEKRLNGVENRLDQLDKKIDYVEKSLSEKIGAVWTAVQELRTDIDEEIECQIEAISKRIFHT